MLLSRVDQYGRPEGGRRSGAGKGYEAMERIGAGRLILVVGPSGAGKDTLIGRAKAALRGRPQFVFPRRVVTRPSGAYEDHDSLDPAAFAAALAAGRFELAWKAHGLGYALPRSIDQAIREERTVICNVSRRIIAAARELYAKVRVIRVEAPAEILALRLERRGREQNLLERIARSDALGPDHADVVIDNGGDLDEAAAAFIAAIMRMDGCRQRTKISRPE